MAVTRVARQVVPVATVLADRDQRVVRVSGAPGARAPSSPGVDCVNRTTAPGSNTIAPRTIRAASRVRPSPG